MKQDIIIRIIIGIIAIILGTILLLSKIWGNTPIIMITLGVCYVLYGLVYIILDWFHKG